MLLQEIKRHFDVAIGYIDRVNKSYVSFAKMLKFDAEFEEEEDDGNIKLSKIENIEIKKCKFLI